jgi:hypothetical protein
VLALYENALAGVSQVTLAKTPSLE